MQVSTFTAKPTVYNAPKDGPIRPSNRFGWGCDTRRHARLEALANRRLAKAGFFPKADDDLSEVIVPAECCSNGKGLQPLWHGSLPKPSFVEADYQLNDDDREWLGACQAA